MLVDFISDLHIGVNYDKVISMKKDIAWSIQEQRLKDNGVFIPTGLAPGKTIFFATDNGDVKIDTPDGKKKTSWYCDCYISRKTIDHQW